jgi:hypothetical protein
LGVREANRVGESGHGQNRREDGGWRTLVCGREREEKGSGAVECFLRHHTEKMTYHLCSAVAKAEMR